MGGAVEKRKGGGGEGTGIARIVGHSEWTVAALNIGDRLEDEKRQMRGDPQLN